MSCIHKTRISPNGVGSSTIHQWHGHEKEKAAAVQVTAAAFEITKNRWESRKRHATPAEPPAAASHSKRRNLINLPTNATFWMTGSYG